MLVQAIQAQTIAPAINKKFSLPLSDGTMAKSIILATTPGNAILLYSTENGDFVLYNLTPMELKPDPNPEPPIPPKPQKLSIAIVEDVTSTTPEQIKILSSLEWRKVAAENHDFLGIIPVGLVDRKTSQPPPRLAPFLRRAEGKVLPWFMFANADGAILFESTLPKTTAEIITLIRKYGG